MTETMHLEVPQDILAALKVGIQDFAQYMRIAAAVACFQEKKLSLGKAAQLAGFNRLDFLVMGCIVNGPGESKDANIGLSLPGTGEDPMSPVYVDGERVTALSGSGRIVEFKRMIEEYVESHYRV